MAGKAIDTTDAMEEPERVATEGSRAVLVIHSPDVALIGRSFPMGRRFGIGRVSGDGVDLALPSDTSVSRVHATIERNGDSFHIRDEGSRNGTYVNGARVQRIDLEAHAIIRIGKTLLELTLDAITGAEDAEIIGRSPAALKMVRHLERAARSDLPVLLLGETGTGKELAAKRVHELSKRSGPLVAVNCAAIPKDLAESFFFGHKKGAFTGALQDQQGYLATARGGTLFLDELGELPVALQPKLLRALESHEFVPVGGTTTETTDARIVAATNVDLESASNDGSFRKDLFARVAGYVVRLPPLRERRSDIPLLLRHFLRTLAKDRELSFGHDFLEPLLLHDWPMNIRELKRVVQRVLLDDHDDAELTKDSLAEVFEVKAPVAAPAPAQPSKDELSALLREHHGNVARIADQLQRQRVQVYRWLKQYDLDPTSFRTP